MAIVKRRAMRRGLRSNNQVWRWIAVLIVGRSSVVRSIAIRDGLRGGNRFWRTVALGIMVTDLAAKVTVKQPERVATERLRVGQSVRITALPPDGGRRAAS
jgi:hypothetical protein